LVSYSWNLRCSEIPKIIDSSLGSDEWLRLEPLILIKEKICTALNLEGRYKKLIS
jgi:hypothetical protein